MDKQGAEITSPPQKKVTSKKTPQNCDPLPSFQTQNPLTEEMTGPLGEWSLQ